MNPPSAELDTISKPHFQLHLLVVIAAFTAVLGEWINLPASTLVAWRTAIAALFLGLWLRGKAWRLITPHHRRIALLTGLILGLHWLTFFAAVKLANVSICLIAISTTSLFTAATEAIYERRRPFSHEILLGTLIVPAIALIAGVEQGHIPGLLCGLASALFASIFPVFNKVMVRNGGKPSVLSFYELITASLICILASIILGYSWLDSIPLGIDWLWLGILAVVCTVYAFSLHIRLLEFFSAYETTLVMNFEPVYGIILAMIFLAEHQKMHPLFFVGAGVIIVVNLLYPIMDRRAKRKSQIE